MFDFDILSWAIGLVLVLPILILVWRKTKNPIFVLLSLLFCFYIVQVAKITILDFPMPYEYGYVELKDFHFNLIPFKMGMPYGSETWFDILEPFFLNIVLTIPLGIFACTFWNLKPRSKYIFVFCAGVSIELIQLVISLIVHFPYRVVDINDAIANGAGVVLGYAVFSFFCHLYKRWFSQLIAPKTKLHQWLAPILDKGN